jgi:hypothetical protein
VSEGHSSVLRDWLRDVGGCYPKANYVPECIMRSSSLLQSHFIRGLFEDGCVNVKGTGVDYIEWSSCFPKLTKQVRYLLTRLGIICSLNSQKRQELLYIYGSECKKFRKKIGFISEFKQNRLVNFTYPDSSKYLIPITKFDLRRFQDYFPKRQDYRNCKQRGYITRRTASLMLSKGCKEAREWLKWHYTKIASITPSTSSVVCLEVPDGNKFLQNGFPFGNSQGSEWDRVALVNQKAKWNQARWLYTGITRAAKELIVYT